MVPSFTKCDFQGMKTEKSQLLRECFILYKQVCRKMIQQMLELRIFIFFQFFTLLLTHLQKNNIQTLRKLNNFGSRTHSFLLTYDNSGLLARKNNQHS